MCVCRPFLLLIEQNVPNIALDKDLCLLYNLVEEIYFMLDLTEDDYEGYN